MVRIILIIFIICFMSCSNKFHISKNKNGEPIISDNLYTLNQKMSINDSRYIDTTYVYLEITPEYLKNKKLMNPNILIFHNDGFVEKTSVKYFRKYKNHRGKQSVYYGGKFILNENKIKIEKFYPSKENRTNYYIREISNGIFSGDSLIINFFDSKHIYVKDKLIIEMK